MDIKLKEDRLLGVSRSEQTAEIKEVLVHDDLLHPETESISVCFRGPGNSGIITFTPREIAELHKTVQRTLGLVKKAKRFEVSRI